MNKYVAPEFGKSAFNCPFCNVFAQQKWLNHNFQGSNIINYSGIYYIEKYVVICTHCTKYSIWLNKTMIYPALSTAPLPHQDMPEVVRDDYLEARNILNESPRGACALLRLALDKLCDELDQDCQGKMLNEKIKILVNKGLSSKLQKMFDFVRITGNDAVHEIGEINPKDNPEIASALFTLINMIVEKMISEPKKVDELYDLIPDSKKDAIAERDKPQLETARK